MNLSVCQSLQGAYCCVVFVSSLALSNFQLGLMHIPHVTEVVGEGRVDHFSVTIIRASLELTIGV